MKRVPFRRQPQPGNIHPILLGRPENPFLQSWMKENDSVASLSILQHADLTACFPCVQFDLRELAKIAGLRAIGIFIHSFLR